MRVLEMSSIECCEVTLIKPVGEGLRVCIDFIDALSPREGVMVGNTGHGYIMVLSENVSTETYPARPFRVNAGAIHQYLLLQGGKTCYLSELNAGDNVPVFSVDKERPISVGRIKIERRELLRIECKVSDKILSSTMQASDSVHFFCEDKTVDVISLNVGDKIACCIDNPGRHLGERRNEYIDEK
uniref:3-dehydroquinate synthase II n=1 Tax=Candidatus Kentrum sp. FM TaxID=2126340 RepID=A0A450SCW9_9GAMM|nr:MAG: 3-dehydroquinate synthase II [Candidatus Kentron sp. FM]VFJ50327.1 MAG: 3-dehydroquinate synthase II [Candidatus Kentron sp. FM]VFK19194.1 MAG: 3-dehydroquinate synthase II [Candidatus Kentron sp. FM]